MLTSTKSKTEEVPQDDNEVRETGGGDDGILDQKKLNLPAGSQTKNAAVCIRVLPCHARPCQRSVRGVIEAQLPHFCLTAIWLLSHAC